MASNWPSCISPCKNTRNDSWSCCSLIGHKKTKVLWHQSEARTTPTVWNWSGKTVSPGAPRFVLYFSSPKFFFARYDFPSPPLTAPGSPRMWFGRSALMTRVVCFSRLSKETRHCFEKGFCFILMMKIM